MAALNSVLSSISFLFALCHFLPYRVAFAKQILVVPFANVSHTLIIEVVARRLAERGHEVSVLWATDFQMPAITRSTYFKLIEFSLKTSREEFESIQQAVQQEFLTEARRSMEADKGVIETVLKAYEQTRSMIARTSLVAGASNRMCELVLSDGRLMSTLRERKFDIALVDDFFFSRCLYVIPQALGVPYVSVGETSSGWDMRLPLLPSAFIGPEVSEVTFAMRVASILPIIVRQFFGLVPSYFYYSEEVLRLAKLSKNEYAALPSRSALFLFLWDDYMTGYTLPKLPHVVFIGGVTAGPAKSLDRGTDESRQLKAWADGATDGFIVCSFGTVLEAPTEHMIDKLFDLFAGLKLPVVFKLSNQYLTEQLKRKLPSNVLLLEWLPQNDLLGHPNARLFVTHAGSNGYAEGLYHGVPLLAFPFILPQRLMAERLEALGFGKQASLVSMTGAELVALGTEVLADKRYRERLQRLSAAIRARKHPAEAAADAVEDTLKFDAHYLRPHAAYQLNFIQFYMLDVLFILFIVMIVALIATFAIISQLTRCAFTKCFKSREKHHKKTKAD